jgi:hypothetical protein
LLEHSREDSPRDFRYVRFVGTQRESWWNAMEKILL